MNRRTALVIGWTILFAVQLVVITYFQEGPLRGATYLYIVPLIPGLLWSARVADVEVDALRRLIKWVFQLSTIEIYCGIATAAVTGTGLLTRLMPQNLTVAQDFTLAASIIGWIVGGSMMLALYAGIRRFYPELDIAKDTHR